MSFEAALAIGRASESLIARWLIRRGFAVQPVYEKVLEGRKGPQLFSSQGDFTAPDLLAFRHPHAYWIEAKHKTAFTFYRRTGKFETGIDIDHYLAYLRVREITGIPLWLFFLHSGGTAKDSPESPSGLFVGDIDIMKERESHRSARYGRSGMVYWTRQEDGGPLTKIAEFADLATFAAALAG